MATLSPTIEGFRVAFRRPSLTLGEISWRWSVGGAACAVLLFGLVEYLGTLPVTRGDLLFLRTGQPILIAQALAHIFRGSLGRVIVAVLVGSLPLTALWITAGSLARLATIRGLVDYFHSNLANRHAAQGGEIADESTSDVGENDDGPDQERVSRTNAAFRSLILLNFLRATLALATICAFAGATILAGFVSPDSHPRPGLAFMLFLPLAALTCLISWALNWILSLANIFAARGADTPLEALSRATAFCRERRGPVAAVSTWVGLAHLALFIAATTVVSMPLGLLPVVPWRIVLLLVILLTLAYFMVADWLYMARLAGYVFILEAPESLLAPQLPSPPSAPTVQTSIDSEEPILSDVPLSTG